VLFWFTAPAGAAFAAPPSFFSPAFMPITPYQAFSGLFSAGTLPRIAAKKGEEMKGKKMVKGIPRNRGRSAFDHFLNSELPISPRQPTEILHFKKMFLKTTKTRQIILNLPGFFLSFLDEPVILCVTDQQRDTKKASGGRHRHKPGGKAPSVRRPFYPLTGPLKNFYGVLDTVGILSFSAGKWRIAGRTIAKTRFPLK
jgi:hypothetical protein